MMRIVTAAAAILTAAFVSLTPLTPAQAAVAAPVSAEGTKAGHGLLTQPARWHGGRGYHRGFYRPARLHRPWRPAYRPVYYRPRPVYIAPPVYGPRVVCRIQQQRVWNGWRHVWRPTRVCFRRW